ncbi:MAG: GGDEF domain-containing protein [Chromatiales bacterium]|nr:GGDEF domain-containing protein [Chromatiales bacterium]
MTHSPLSSRVRIAQTELLYFSSPLRPVLHAIPGGILFWLTFETVGVTASGLWFAALMLINIGRYVHIQVVRRTPREALDWNRLSRLFVVGSALVGIAYGAGLVWFMPQLSEFLQLAVVSVAVTVIPGAMVSYSSSWSAFLVYLAPKLGLPMVLCLLLGDAFHLYLFFYGLVYLLVLLTLFNWYYKTLVETIRVRLENADLLATLTESNEKLTALSTRDGLTGLANRRHLDELLEHELVAATRHGLPLAVLMLDIDFFKEYNDEYGHIRGDECLQALSAMLVSTFKRRTDIVARYGGEEFCLVVPNTDAEAAQDVAREVQARMAELDIEHHGSRVSDQLTLSIGIAAWVPTPGDTAGDFLHAADSELYAAKRGGRNQVRVHRRDDGATAGPAD